MRSRVTPPAGGFFIWIELPEGYSADDLHGPAKDAGVLFVKGSDKGTIRTEAYEVERPQYPKTSFFAQQSSQERAGM